MLSRAALPRVGGGGVFSFAGTKEKAAEWEPGPEGGSWRMALGMPVCWARDHPDSMLALLQLVSPLPLEPLTSLLGEPAQYHCPRRPLGPPRLLPRCPSTSQPHPPHCTELARLPHHPPPAQAGAPGGTALFPSSGSQYCPAEGSAQRLPSVGGPSPWASGQVAHCDHLEARACVRLAPLPLTPSTGLA